MSYFGKVRWAAFQPLIGGCDIGAQQSFGCPPTCVIDYDGVANSDLYLNYMSNVKKTPLKHFVIDGGAYSLAKDLKKDEEGNPIYSWSDPELQNLDVVVGVPICAGLSSANTQNSASSKMGRGSDAMQNNNMLGMLDITLNTIKPKVYIFENAYKLATPLGAGIKEKLIKLANEAGYATNIVKVNTINHGLPQNRTRTFFVAYRGDVAPLMTYEPTPCPTIMDVLEGLPPQQSAFQERNSDDGWIQYLKDKWGPNYREEWAKHASAADFVADECGDMEMAKKYFDEKGQRIIDYCIGKKAQGKGWMSGAPLYYGPSKLPSLYGRSMGRCWHPTEERGYSLRECMRLMAMPDDFECPPKGKVGMIGQNVPVCTAAYYTDQVLKYLDGELKLSEQKNVEQDFCSTGAIRKEAKLKPIPKTGFGAILSK